MDRTIAKATVGGSNPSGPNHNPLDVGSNPTWPTMKKSIQYNQKNKGTRTINPGMKSKTVSKSFRKYSRLKKG